MHWSFVVPVGGYATVYFVPNYHLSAVEMATQIRLDYSDFNFIVNGMRFHHFHDQKVFVANGRSHVRFSFILIYSSRNSGK